MRDALATPLPVDGHAPYAKRHWTTKRRSKPVQQRPNLPFVWSLSQLRRYQDCRRGWETGALDSALLISTSTTSERLTDLLVFCIVVGFLRGQTDIGTNLYRRTHVMTSSMKNNNKNSVLVHFFFCGFYFRGSRSVCENRENLHPAKISRYTVYPLLEKSGANPGTIAAYAQGLIHGVKYTKAENSIKQTMMCALIGMWLYAQYQ